MNDIKRKSLLGGDEEVRNEASFFMEAMFCEGPKMVD